MCRGGSSREAGQREGLGTYSGLGGIGRADRSKTRSMGVKCCSSAVSA